MSITEMSYYGYNMDGAGVDELKAQMMKPVGPLPLVAWIGIGAGVLVLIIIIAVVVSKKKKKAVSASAPATRSASASAPATSAPAASAPAKPEPPVNQAGQDQPQAIAPKPPVEQTPQVTYTFHQGMDSGGNDIKQAANLANNVAGLKAACTALPNCKAFNTNGWLKHTVLPNAQWYKWTSEANKGMYTRN